MSLLSSDFAYVADVVRRDAGIVLDRSKTYLVDTRLRPVLRAHRLASVTELVDRLRSGRAGGLRHEVVAAMTTNETSFFRDVHPWQALETDILPELIAARSHRRELRIWCAACASGQEPYSLALLLRERFAHLTGWRIDIVGTDISRPVLDRARRGTYSELETRRGLPASLRDKWFASREDVWELHPDIRRMVRFEVHNLLSDPPVGDRLDLVLLRNVLIYFDVATKQRILAGVRRALAPDGTLLLGASESTLTIDASFAPRRIGSTTCYTAT